MERVNAATYGQAAKKSLSILVVDDTPSYLAVLVEALAGPGRIVTGADSVSRALPLVREQSFDLIVSDFSMPGLSGIDFLGIVRLLYPSQAFILSSADLPTDAALIAERNDAWVIAKSDALVELVALLAATEE
jgi:CheY-like chemotaxis protein